MSSSIITVDDHIHICSTLHATSTQGSVSDLPPQTCLSSPKDHIFRYFLSFFFSSPTPLMDSQRLSLRSRPLLFVLICFLSIICFSRWQQTYQVPTLLVSRRRAWRPSRFSIAPPGASTGSRKVATAMLLGVFNQPNFKLGNCQLLYTNFWHWPTSLTNYFWKPQYCVY